jgi:glycosyltransferase involved in cell wall biosynthesis
MSEVTNLTRSARTRWEVTAQRLSVVLPAYNEEAAIADDIAAIQDALDDCGAEYEIIVVDDGSTDQTAAIAARFDSVRVIRHPQNRGTGAARTTGMRAAQGDIVVMTDVDGTYPNHDMPRLLEAMAEADMVIGARKHEAGTARWLRAPTKWFIRMLAQFLTNTRIPDLNSGFRAFRRDVALRYLTILPNTHSWVSTITLAFLSDGYRVAYIPIDYYPRKGRSSFHPVSDTYNYLTLVVRSIMYFNPLKVFLPITVLLLVVGIVKFIRDLFVYGSVFYIPGITLLLLFMAVQVGALGLLADLIVRRTKGPPS